MEHVKRKDRSNEEKPSSQSLRHKEKRRTESLNKAFCELRKCIPHVPCDTKLSKIKTLQLASAYIAYLSGMLRNPGTNNKKAELNIPFNPCLLPNRKKKSSVSISMVEPFAVEVANFNSNIQTRTSESDLSLKKTKGRTGWPETVWAEALENGSPKSSDFKFTNMDSLQMLGDNQILPSNYGNTNIKEPTSLYGSVFMLGGSSDCVCTYEICCSHENDSDILESTDEVLSFSSQIKNSDVLNATSSITNFSSSHFTGDSLPSISTLCSGSRQKHELDIGLSYNSEFISNPSVIDFNQNESIEEPSFVELQPVTKSRSTCGDMI